MSRMVSGEAQDPSDQPWIVPVEDRLLSVAEVQAVLGVGKNFVYDLFAAGELPSFKIGCLRKVRYGDVKEWLAKQRHLLWVFTSPHHYLSMLHLVVLVHFLH